MRPAARNTKLPEVHAHITASGFSAGQQRCTTGKPFVAAEVEQGVDAVHVFADRGDRHRQACTAPSTRASSAGKSSSGAVAGIEEAHRWHAHLPWIMVTEIGRLSTMLSRASYDASRLGGALRSEIRGSARRRGQPGLYAVDASNYRVAPDLVIVPADAEDLATAVMLHRQRPARAVTLRGGGTSMAGNAIGGVVIDASRHVNRILDIDTAGPNRRRRTRRGAHRPIGRPAARAHVRRRSVIGQPRNDRRDDRQQRLRRPLRAHGAPPRTTFGRWT